jgi:hypothetical protein
MRRLLAVILLPGLALLPLTNHSALAQVAPIDEAPAAHVHLTWEQHFAQANTAHDGHLTLDEAKAGYPTVARKFRAIDVDGKGFVTENDMRAWHAAQKVPHAPAKESENTLRPRNAFHLSRPSVKPLNTSATTVVTVPADSLRETDAPPEPE